mmetsp:Transcript_42843/g.79866  ORF Transcript_42843/g.79866 Transcript_42843/m.79866 type:complete len:240 (+) Transcript_42843:46-765(+)
MLLSCCCNNAEESAAYREAYTIAEDAKTPEGSQPFPPPANGMQDSFTEQLELEEPAAVLHKDGRFQVQLDKSNGPFGLCLDYESKEPSGADFKDRCLIFNIKGGAAEQWNKMYPDKALQVGDCIFAVNGVSGTSKTLFESIKDASKVEIDVLRPKELTIKGRGGRPLGLHLEYADSSVGLIVTQVNDGPVKDWNASNPSTPVVPGDRILEVNGCTSGIADKMTEVLQREDLTLRVLSWP